MERGEGAGILGFFEGEKEEEEGRELVGREAEWRVGDDTEEEAWGGKDEEAVEEVDERGDGDGVYPLESGVARVEELGVGVGAVENGVE